MQLWSAKAPGEIIKYTWSVPVADGDSLSSYTASASGAVIDDQDSNNDDVILYVSGGTAGTVASFTLVAYTEQGETLNETIYLPILPIGNAAAFGETAQDIIEFALRPIVGISGTPTTDELADGLEWLNLRLAAWKVQGADVGAPLPLTLASTINCPDQWLQAIKLDLRIFTAEQYGRQVSPATAIMAAKGLQTVKQESLSDDRGQGSYY